MDLGEAMTAAGIGCRRGASADAVLAAIRAACAAAGVAGVDALAVVPAKAEEAGVRAAAAMLGVPVLVGAVAAGDARLLSHSAASLAASGTPSASEAAALAAAGVGARLIGPRLALGPVTCALARGERA